MSQDIFPVPISKLEDLEDLYQAIDFFRKHKYHLPSITQSDEGLSFATKYWLNPRVKSDKYIFSIQNEVDSVINNLLLQHGSNEETPQDSISEPDESEAAEDESESREDEGIVRYDDKNARQRRELEQRQASRPLLKRSRRSLFESYESKEFKSMIRKGLEIFLKDK